MTNSRFLNFVLLPRADLQSFLYLLALIKNPPVVNAPHPRSVSSCVVFLIKSFSNLSRPQKEKFGILQTEDGDETDFEFRFTNHVSRFHGENYVYSREKRILLIIREIACKTT